MDGITSAPLRIPLGVYPTPFQKIEDLSPLTDEGRRFFVKREDLVGVGLGGNKIRRMEYLLGEALAKGCDCLIVGGGSRSNQTIAAASCAAEIGIPVHLVIPQSTGAVARGLAELLDATVHFSEDGQTTSLNRKIREVSDSLKSEGKRPYIIRPGADGALGILGYVDAMKEMYSQAAERHVHIDHVFCCGGTGVTYSGVLLGTKLYSPDTRATAISIGRRFKHADTLVEQILEAAKIGGYQLGYRDVCVGGLDDSETVDSKIKNSKMDASKADNGKAYISAEDVHVHFSCGQGASEPTIKGKEAMKIMASRTGIFLDPLYTGKAFAGVLELEKQGYFQPGENIAFVHTGGLLTLMTQYTMKGSDS